MIKGKNLVLIFMLVITVSILTLPVRASEAREGSSAMAEHSEAVEAQGEHATAEEHDVAGGHGEEAAHEEREEPWWRFPGWEIAFAVLASAFFLLLMRWLPIILEDKSGGSV